MTLLMISLLMFPSRGASPLAAPQHNLRIIRLAAFLASEFRDGIPPRFVLRGIPKRIERIKSGMSPQQVTEILGLNQSWLLGGISARPSMGYGNGHYETLTYEIGRRKLVTVQAKVSGVPQAVQIVRSRALIQLWFDTDIQAGIQNWWKDQGTRLTRVSYSEDGKKVVDVNFKG